MVDDLCGSVPHHTGTKLEGGPGEDAGVEYPYTAYNSLPQDQRRSPAALSGWHLIEPLKIAVELTGLCEGQ